MEIKKKYFKILEENILPSGHYDGDVIKLELDEKTRLYVPSGNPAA